MRSNDLKNRDDIRSLIQKAIKENDTEGFYNAFDEMLQAIESDIKEEYGNKLNALRQEMDSRVLTARGVRQLTSKEKEFYQKVAEAMKSRDPKQALANLDVVLPETTIDSVFEDIGTNHPLLSKINFIPSGGAVKLLMNTNGYQTAVWGKLCDEIIKEIASGFKEVDTNLLKLSAFLPVCKAMLDLGPEWLDRYVREVLYEAAANGLEVGIVTGTGRDEPIGMNREVGDGVTVTGGVYPLKAKIKITDLSADTIGNLLALIAIDPNGKSRVVKEVILIVNPQDYFQKVFPATTIMAPDGTYRKDVLPYPMDVIQSVALDPGDAIIGIAYRYFAAAGTAKGGNIEYSDEYRFLEDERMYLIKIYANGMPMDNNAFLPLDISGLRPATWKVEMVEGSAPSADATLTDIRIGTLDLDPEFAAETTAYAVATTNASNTVTAYPADAGANIEVFVGENEINNGTAAKWVDGENTLTIKVTAADGSTTKTYTVTVTKS